MTGREECGTRGWVLATIAIAAALAFLAGPPAVRLVAKPGPVLCLAFWVFTAGKGPSARAVLFGLLLSAVGDVLLEASPRLFLPGLLAFLAAHVAYTAAFVRGTSRARPLRAVPFAVWGLLGYLAMSGGLGALRLPVIVYLAAICVMMWRAAAVVGCTGPSQRHEWLVLAGAVLFGMSDTLLGLDRFRAPIDGVRIPIIVLYWLGQLGIATSTTLRGAPAGSAR